MSDWALEWLTFYGLAAFFVILVVTSAGVPFPITLTLVVVGSLVAQGQFDLWQVLLIGTAGAVIGDLIGYALGRHGGRRMVNRITAKFGGEANVKRAEDFTRKWGAWGIFFSRWLVTPLSPWLNLTSGASFYPFARFAVWVFVGKAIWIVLYVMLGMVFSDRVELIADMMGDITWALVGLAAAMILSWKLYQYLRQEDEEANEPAIGRSIETTQNPSLAASGTRNAP